MLLLSFDLTISWINFGMHSDLQVLYTINLMWVIVEIILLLVAFTVIL
jgi:hypothetical protein